MDSIKVRELPEKNSINLRDKIVIEDNDGTKTVPASKIKDLLNTCIICNTVEDMKNTSFNENDIVLTLGYHNKGDGGSAIYIIEYAPTDIDDGIFIHYLHTSDTLRAHFIVVNEINILQTGAMGDGITDDYSKIIRAINSGYQINFPNKRYKISTPITLSRQPSKQKNINFNNCTFICESGYCFRLYESDIKICNCSIESLNGIEVGPTADRCEISNVKITSTSNLQQLTGIKIFGGSTVNINNCSIGNSSQKTLVGISMCAGNLGSTDVENRNITINNCNIKSEQKCISSECTLLNKGLSIYNTILSGYENIDNSTTIGIYIGSNDTSILIDKCRFNAVKYGIMSTGLIKTNINVVNVEFVDTRFAYNVLSNNTKLLLYGMQRFCGSNSSISLNDYIFDNMNGILYINTNGIIIDPIYENHLIKNILTPSNGKLYDINKYDMINSIELSYTQGSDTIDLTSDPIIFNTIITYNALYGKTKYPINKILGGVNGQIIGIKCEDLVIDNIQNIRVKKDPVELSPDIPVYLQKRGSIWYEI